jgi:MSHA biogenesis protein MshJ
MIKHLQPYKERFDALSLRERALVLLAVLACLYMIWDAFVMERLHQRQDQALAQMDNWREQLSDVDKRIRSVTEKLNPAGQKEARQRLADLKTELTQLNRRQEALAVSFIRPQEMVSVLKGLLVEEGGLELTRLQSIAAQPFMFPPEGAKEQHPLAEKARQVGKPASAQDSAKETDKPEVPVPEVYKHGLEIEFQGDYASTLSYLQKIEALPWRFYWDEVGYEVLQYPKAQITVKIHTLSLEKGWIRV